jgi:hypothetical protein
VLLGVTAAHATTATATPAALRVKPTDPEPDFGWQVDHKLRRESGDVLDLAPAARAPQQGREEVLVNMVWHRPVGRRVTGLASGPPGTILATATPEWRSLALGGAQRLFERSFEPLDLATLSPVLCFRAARPRGQGVALGPQRVALDEQRRERCGDDCADPKVVEHDRMMILSMVRTTFSRSAADRSGVSIAFERQLSS